MSSLQDFFNNPDPTHTKGIVQKNNIIKTDADKVSGEDCREGLSCVISVKLTEAQFEGQTKAKLGKQDYHRPW